MPAGSIDNLLDSCYNYTCSENGSMTLAMKSRPRVHRPQRGFPRLEETCQRRVTDTLEPPGENRACPHVTAAKRRCLRDNAKMGGTASCF